MENGGHWLRERVTDQAIAGNCQSEGIEFASAFVVTARAEQGYVTAGAKQ
jgi:hypothetical protein